MNFVIKLLNGASNTPKINKALNFLKENVTVAWKTTLFIINNAFKLFPIVFNIDHKQAAANANNLSSYQEGNAIQR